MKKSKFRVLESFYACETILYLSIHPEGVQKVDYRTKLNISPSTAMKLHALFFEYDIIEVKSDPDKFLFVLTEKGKKLASKIKEIENIIK
jgi:predicted transcriptional regulator